MPTKEGISPVTAASLVHVQWGRRTPGGSDSARLERSLARTEDLARSVIAAMGLDTGRFPTARPGSAAHAQLRTIHVSATRTRQPIKEEGQRRGRS